MVWQLILQVAYTHCYSVQWKSAQRWRKHCAQSVVKRSKKKFAPPQTPSWGRGIEKNNQLEMVTTFTLQSQFGDDGARNFQLSW